ncbi:NAD(P)-binding protein [Calocera viscosa TUFC12733]|uniref:NAD(P)-binding protein n=1 Tax=Calocera viscosa (strain TUFC12733) TaxID=1330018 RepID=A0A167JAV8_CALVF|nr:NAD(P)-binding protein [Calocera viscosa TUFC12733]
MSRRIPDLPPNTTLQGRSVLITGANSGLGYSAALLCLQLGASPVYLAVRTMAKGNIARSSLLADPIVRKRNPYPVVEVYELDMCRWESVTSFGHKFVGDRSGAAEGLDIAMLNAGLGNTAWELAPTGNEETIQVNHLSTALLALLLLPLLESSTTPEHTARLMIVSSGQHRSSGVESYPPDNINYLASLNEKKNFSVMRTYGLSKLLIIFFLRELSARVNSNKVIINNVCPGMIKTQLPRKAPSWTAPILWALALREANPVEKGASCYVHAVACLGKESHGLWYRRMRLTPYLPFVTTPDGEKTQKRVWNETMQMLEKVVPGISANV